MVIECVDCGARERTASNLYWHGREAHSYRPADCYDLIARSLDAHVGPFVDTVPPGWEPRLVCEVCSKRAAKRELGRGVLGGVPFGGDHLECEI